ncbi:uncharacterized protein V1510DRAFT_411385 [Dipodascopsis tothii]|uniref:uncharacterized protein n=1 Tax=Dipodascopsis tothii TaxID=44089 RepID=UPI0034CDB711
MGLPFLLSMISALSSASSTGAVSGSTLIDVGELACSGSAVALISLRFKSALGGSDAIMSNGDLTFSTSGDRLNENCDVGDGVITGESSGVDRSSISAGRGTAIVSKSGRAMVRSQNCGGYIKNARAARYSTLGQ